MFLLTFIFHFCWVFDLCLLTSLLHSGFKVLRSKPYPSRKADSKWLIDLQIFSMAVRTLPKIHEKTLSSYLREIWLKSYWLTTSPRHPDVEMDTCDGSDYKNGWLNCHRKIHCDSCMFHGGVDDILSDRPNENETVKQVHHIWTSGNKLPFLYHLWSDS